MARDGTEDPQFHKAEEATAVREADDVPGEGPIQDPPSQRLGCLTAWLVLMVLANGFALVGVPLRMVTFVPRDPNVPEWVVWPTVALAFLNVVFTTALIAWKRWGFFGLVATSLGAFALNVYLSVPVPLAVIGLVGVVIVFVLLRIGGPKSAWSQLE